MSTDKIGLKEKIGYGFGDAAASMFWKLFAMYLGFFYTDVFGISAAAVATMFLITRTWDAGFDPIVGILGDRTETRWGKFRPYILWMAFPFGILGVLLFTTPGMAGTGKLVYAYITYSLMWIVYSMINVPYASLMGVMTSDSNERTSLATFRFIFAFGGSFLVLLIVKPLADFFTHFKSVPSPQFGWQMAAIVIAALAVLFFMFTFSWTRERLKPIEAKTNLASDLKDLCKNGPWFILLGAGIATIFFNSIRDGAAVYYFKYFIEEKCLFSVGKIEFFPSTLYLVLGQAANIIGVVLATPVSKVLGKKGTYMGAMVAAAIFSMGFHWIHGGNIALIFTLQVLVSIAAGIIFPLLWSMYADTSDYSEWKSGRRATGLVFSASSMTQKFGGAIGTFVVLRLLDFYGYKANQAQAASTLTGIQAMLSYLPAAGAALSAFFMIVYPLSTHRMQEIGEDLAKTRAAVPEAEA